MQVNGCASVRWTELPSEWAWVIVSTAGVSGKGKDQTLAAVLELEMSKIFFKVCLSLNLNLRKQAKESKDKGNRIIYVKRLKSYVDLFIEFRGKNRQNTQLQTVNTERENQSVTFLLGGSHSDCSATQLIFMQFIKSIAAEETGVLPSAS